MWLTKEFCKKWPFRKYEPIGTYIDYFQISGIVGGNFDLGKIDTYIHLREDNGVEPFHQFGLELDVMEVRFDYMSTSVLMGRVSHLLLKVSTVTTYPGLL